jgi:site-specific DNA recombinase
MFQHFQGIFAEYERALILDRSRRGRIYKAKQGNPSIIPCLPYGYRKEKKGDKTIVVVVENEAEVVRSIFKAYTYDKLPLTTISNNLTMQCVKSPNGLSRWDLATLRKMLNNQTYTGTSYFGKTESCAGKSNKMRHHKSGVFIKAKFARRMRPEEDWIPISVPAIISESDFEQAQEQVKKNKLLASRNTKIPTLLQGLVICGECGYPFYKRSKSEARAYYHCRSRAQKNLKKCSNRAVRQEDLDNLVFDEVVKLLKKPVLLEQELERRRRAVDSNSDEIKTKEMMIKKDLSKVENERERLLDAFQRGLARLEDLSERNRDLDDRRKTLENELKGIQYLKLESEKDFDIKGSLKKLIPRLDKVSGNLHFDDKRKLVRLLVEKVVVEVDKITICHCISPNSLAQETGQLKGDGVERAQAVRPG